LGAGSAKSRQRLAQQTVLTGVNWTDSRYPSAFDRGERHDEVLQGEATQVLWNASLAHRVALQAFVQLGYIVDSEELDWNNKVRPSLGLQVSLQPWEGTVLAIGARYDWEHRFVTDRTLTGATGFANWSGWWGIDTGVAPERDALGPLGYVIQTYGEVRYPSDREVDERDNMIIEGAVRGDIDWIEWNGARLATSGEIQYAADTKSLEWNNKITPSIGLILKSRAYWWGELELGLQYAADYRFVTGNTQTGLVTFLSYYTYWGL
jgi:hypothetical protein